MSEVKKRTEGPDLIALKRAYFKDTLMLGSLATKLVSSDQYPINLDRNTGLVFIKSGDQKYGIPVANAAWIEFE